MGRNKIVNKSKGKKNTPGESEGGPPDNGEKESRSTRGGSRQASLRSNAGPEKVKKPTKKPDNIISRAFKHVWNKEQKAARLAMAEQDSNNNATVIDPNAPETEI